MSILDNIKLLKPTATEEEVIASSKKANIHDYIISLPKSYNTFIAEGEKELSVGQKQRIAIARALIRKPQMLLLDEATSNLDTESEEKISETIKKLSNNMIILVIAHRLSTVRNCDKIYVLHNGKFTESGNHIELIQKKGLYKQFYLNVGQT